MKNASFYFVRKPYLPALAEICKEPRVEGELSDVQKELIKGIHDYFHRMMDELCLYFKTTDIAEINSELDKIFTTMQDGKSSELYIEDQLVFTAAETLKGCIQSLMGNDFVKFARLLVISSGEISSLTEINKFARKVPAIQKMAISASAKQSVSNRSDIQLKPKWIDHCRNVLISGVEIRTINDFLNIEGYDPAIAGISARTLKAWAREGTGVKFKPGREKKQK